MKDTLQRIGMILLVIGACLYGYFVTYADYKLRASGEAYVDKIVPAIFSSWSKEELARHAAPEFIQFTPLEEWDRFLAQYSGIGSLIEYEGCKYNRVLTKRADISDAVTLVYATAAEFENGAAEINIQIIQKDDEWALLGLLVRSPFYDRQAMDVSEQNKCKHNLRMIDQAKDVAAMTDNRKMGASMTAEDITPFLSQGFSGIKCPKGGDYTIHVVGESAECSAHGSIGKPKASPPEPRRELEQAVAEPSVEIQAEAEREAVRMEQPISAGSQQAFSSDQPTAKDDKRVPAAYKLDGIMGGTGNYRALINGTVFAIGDPIGSGRIHSMDSTRVTIKSAAGTTQDLLVGGRTTIE